MAAMPGYERAALLRRVGALLVAAHRRDRRDHDARDRQGDQGREAARSRARRTPYPLSAEEAIRIEGEQVPLDGSAMGAGKIAFLLRFPVGVVAGITPFNAPFNLACHKIAPAIAAGNSIVLKAPPQSPWRGEQARRAVRRRGRARRVRQRALRQCRRAGAGARSARRLHHLHRVEPRRAPRSRRRAGCAAWRSSWAATARTIVHADADVDEAAALCARNAMRLAGQSCISVQNVYVHESVYDALRRAHAWPR